MGIMADSKASQMARRCSGDTSDCQQRERASHARQYSDSDTYHKKGGVCFLHDIAQIGTHCSVVATSSKIRKEDVSTMTLAAINAGAFYGAIS